MNSDTQLAPRAVSRWALVERLPGAPAAWLARAHARLGALDPPRARAARESWRALWSSRVLVWGVGVATIVAFGYGPRRGAFDPPGLTKGFGWLGNLLTAPAARWDSAWFLEIARA
ncbi:MAG TPA: hypothetical protein VED41_05620, partial [Solirubrobacteraceae bacterium]|nr:hypothetical protein [Solirubrobacteraceae bacterium]